MTTARDEGGFALLMALWAIALIAGAMAFGAAQTTARSDDFRAETDLAEARMAQRAGFALAFNRIAAAGTATPVGRYQASWRGHDIVIRIEDETGKINPNFAPPSLVSALLSELGAPRRSADLIALRLSDFTDRDDATRDGGAEAGDYLSAGRPPPKNAALRNSHEMWAAPGFAALIDGLGPDVDILQFLTVHTRSGGVNLAAATAPVAAAYAKTSSDFDDDPVIGQGIFRAVVQVTKTGGLRLTASHIVALIGTGAGGGTGTGAGAGSIRLLE